jgi:biotin operon repressor
MSIRLRERVKALDLPATLKQVLDALADHADDDGNNCYPSQARLCYETGLKRTAIITNLAKLHEMGLAVKQSKVRGREDTLHYKLFLDRGPFQKPFKEFLLEFSRQKGTRGIPFNEAEWACDPEETGSPDVPKRVRETDEKGTPDGRKGTGSGPYPSLTVHGTVHQPPEDADGAADFIAEMHKTFLEKTGQVLFISQKSGKELRAHLKTEPQELIAECWKVFLDRPQGFGKLDHPVGVFLKELPNSREAAQRNLKQRAATKRIASWRSKRDPQTAWYAERHGVKQLANWWEIFPEEFPHFDFENKMLPEVCRICRYRDGECKCPEPRFGSGHTQISSAK